MPERNSSFGVARWMAAAGGRTAEGAVL